MLQSFGNTDNYVDADVISTVQFEEDGRYLATGDCGGRVVLFKREGQSDKNSSEATVGSEVDEAKTDGLHGVEDGEWTPIYQFQSHTVDFDYLKSLEIEEKITQVKFVKSAGCMQLLSANGKTIKFWKIGNRRFQRYSGTNLENKSEFMKRSLVSPGGASIRLPVLEEERSELLAMPKLEYKNAHAYQINSLSCNSDGESFISADDLRIIWWNLHVGNTGFNVIDLKPQNMEELREVITSATFHPTHCYQLAYSTSRGCLRIHDARVSARGDHASINIEPKPDPMGSDSFFSEVTASISDVKYSNDGFMLAARDYMTVKVWDVRSTKEPVSCIEVQESVREHLSELYECDRIFDKFEVNFSPDGLRVASGLYNNCLGVWNVQTGEQLITHEVTRGRSALDISSHSNHSFSAGGDPDGTSFPDTGPPHAPHKSMTLDHGKKILHSSWHPRGNVVAVAGQSCLYMYGCM